MAEKQIITYRYRVKDKHASHLNQMAREVNFVWNWANDAQKHALKWGRRWPSHFDLIYLSVGATSYMKIGSDTISQICNQYATSRKQRNKPYLRYRGRKSLGWIPFRAAQIRFMPQGIKFGKKIYQVWLCRPIPREAVVKDGGSFSQDAQGHWYLNIAIEIPCEQKDIESIVGIDLGLKDLAVLSTGEKIVAPRIYRSYEKKIGVAKRAKKKKRIKKIYAKIANQRNDFLHKLSTNIVNRFDHIVVGNVNAKSLAKTIMAKSVLDAGWSKLRSNLRYKSIGKGGKFEEVNEAYSSQTCSDCGSISGPKGRKGLKVRQWECVDCGAVHDRDHNSAIFISRLAHETLVAGAA